jgi:hypothetical protein
MSQITNKLTDMMTTEAGKIASQETEVMTHVQMTAVSE